MNWIWSIIIGILAGFLAGVLIRGRGFGCLINLLVGVIGSVLGGWIFSLLNISVSHGSKIGVLTTSTVGAICLLCIVSLFKRR
ncbi:GlsB/YeaQ/YmgE family stress response membrane protein [Apibacter raozihei]|uniref:GlsB/YeaQ/YmgE family stress response membrane protein n=1 Tax=Apibacter TaxID=1778601 RepID=UPI000FE3D265|nr:MULTISPECIES: GlsB/YeaQ/YmgE family stress response membrane protein [Apibacter]